MLAAPAASVSAISAPLMSTAAVSARSSSAPSAEKGEGDDLPPNKKT